MSTRILCERRELSGDGKSSRQERKFGIERFIYLHVFRDIPRLLLVIRICRKCKVISETVTSAAGCFGNKRSWISRPDPLTMFEVHAILLEMFCGRRESDDS